MAAERRESCALPIQLSRFSAEITISPRGTFLIASRFHNFLHLVAAAPADGLKPFDRRNPSLSKANATQKFFFFFFHSAATCFQTRKTTRRCARFYIEIMNEKETKKKLYTDKNDNNYQKHVQLLRCAQLFFLLLIPWIPPVNVSNPQDSAERETVFNKEKRTTRRMF